MNSEKKQLQSIKQIIRENVDKDEVKKKYILQLLENFINTLKEDKKSYNIFMTLIKEMENGYPVNLYHFYQAFNDFIRKENPNNKEIFYKEVILRVYNAFFLGRTKLIDSFIFLESLINIKDYINFSIAYDDLVFIIKKIASLAPSFPKERRKIEGIELYYYFLNVLVNLQNNYNIESATIPIEFFVSSFAFQTNAVEERRLLKKAVQPCVEEIVQLILVDEWNCNNFLLLIKEESQTFEQLFLDKAKNKETIKDYFYLYIRHNKNGRFEELEKIIVQDSQQLLEYLKQGLFTKAPELEPYILQNPIHCVFYVKNALGGRRDKGIEQIVVQDPQACCLYAEEVLNGRFLEGEDTIARNAEASFYYATEVLNARFKKGEKAILKKEKLKIEYKKYFKIKSF